MCIKNKGGENVRQSLGMKLMKNIRELRVKKINEIEKIINKI